jgi:hypothetical protein
MRSLRLIGRAVVAAAAAAAAVSTKARFSFVPLIVSPGPHTTQQEKPSLPRANLAVASEKCLNYVERRSGNAATRGCIRLCLTNRGFS